MHFSTLGICQVLFRACLLKIKSKLRANDYALLNVNHAKYYLCNSKSSLYSESVLPKRTSFLLFLWLHGYFENARALTRLTPH